MPNCFTKRNGYEVIVMQPSKYQDFPDKTAATIFFSLYFTEININSAMGGGKIIC
jgi:hypothetical protein